MIDARILDEEVIVSMHDSGLIKFTETYEAKFKERMAKTNNFYYQEVSGYHSND